MVAMNFVGKTESKTSAELQGIKITGIIYDAEKDIAKATAEITLDTITNIDGQEMNLLGKAFSRVGFATSTPANAPRSRPYEPQKLMPTNNWQRLLWDSPWKVRPL